MNRRYRGRKAALLALLAPVFLGAVAWAAQVVTVVERQAPIRRAKVVYAPPIAVAEEGDKVTLLERATPWVLVERQGTRGWMLESSVTEKADPVLSGTRTAREVRVTEETAAGRGFRPEVEREYQRQNPELQSIFALLDEIQKVTYPQERIVEFLEVGKLAGLGAGGGR